MFEFFYFYLFNLIMCLFVWFLVFLFRYISLFYDYLIYSNSCYFYLSKFNSVNDLLLMSFRFDMMIYIFFYFKGCVGWFFFFLGFRMYSFIFVICFVKYWSVSVYVVILLNNSIYGFFFGFGFVWVSVCSLFFFG